MAKRKRSNHPVLEKDYQKLFFAGRYSGLLGLPELFQLGGTKRDVRKRLRDTSPDLPGVYAYLDDSHQLIYVGMSSRLTKRLRSYFSATQRRRKETRIARRAKWLIWQPAAHTLVAALRERELIEAYEPFYNAQGRPSRITWSYVVQNDAVAPSFSLQKSIPKSHAGVWGPIPYTNFQKAAVEGLNLQFGLRDCPINTGMRFSDLSSEDHQDFTPCLRADLKTCLAPCIQGCSSREYGKAVQKARSFLDGQLEDCLNVVQADMKLAAQQMQFERAARLRDRIQSLTRLDFHLKRFHVWASQATFIYPVLSQITQQKLWLFFYKGTLSSFCAAPQSQEERSTCLKSIEELQRRQSGSTKTRTLVHSHDFSSAKLTHRWFRLKPEEAKLRLAMQRAKQRCKPRVTKKLKNDSDHSSGLT